MDPSINEKNETLHLETQVKLRYTLYNLSWDMDVSIHDTYNQKKWLTLHLNEQEMDFN